MIVFELPHSSFFEENRDYCEHIVSQFETLGFDCTGFCNGFGYEFEITYCRNYLIYNFKFIKYQTTQRSGDAHQYTGVEVTITGLHLKHRLSVSKSFIWRFFLPNKIKKIIPKPYYIKMFDWNNSDLADNIAKVILKNRISRFRLKNGKLTVNIHEQISKPLDLMYDIEVVINSL